MTDEQAIGFLQGKLNCMKKCDLFERTEKINSDECDSCEYCYAQGNFGEQLRTLEFVIKRLSEPSDLDKLVAELSKIDDCDFASFSLGLIKETVEKIRKE